MLTKISVSLYAGGIIIQELTGFSLWTSATIVVLFTGFYTILGGLRAVVYTDLMQSVVLIVGTAVLLFLGLSHVGGWSQLVQGSPTGFFDMWKPASDSQFPWTGIVFGAPILGVWYWCTDQTIVQRTLSAKNETEAQSGTIFAAYLKILPLFLFVVPGIIALALIPELSDGNADSALPKLVLMLLGPGLQGLFVAAMLAALMSSLSSVFNSTSTLITWDIFKKFHPNASERKLVTVGQIATGGLVVIGLLWIPFMKYISGGLYIYLQSVQGYIAPPIAACFLLGLFFPRLNGKGALASLLSGLVLGVVRLILEILNGFNSALFSDGSFLRWCAEINFLHFAALLFVVCSIVLFVVSMMTEKPTTAQVEGLTWTYKKPAQTPTDQSMRNKKLNKGLSIALVGALVVLWMWFS